MRKGLFFRLAVMNIKKNKSTYIPYMLSCVFCIAMHYMMFFLAENKGVEAIPHSRDVAMIMSMGIFVIGIFSFIFLIYSNSFLMKRRQKELGLYNILGMEKGHIGWIMLLETLLSSLLSLVGGILLGILGSKLALLILLKLMHIPAQFGFEIQPKAVCSCVFFYGIVFLLILVNNIRKVKAGKPIELLHGSNVGEREPKAKWLMALIGFICLGSGYYIAVTTESPLAALPLFLLAVLLVMAGTYLLFTTGSIAILNILRWKKSFYYKTKNFTSVSGMIYRMKQNAMGLASICILSTGVLLMISTTVCLNSGLDDMMENRYPYEVSVRFHDVTLKQGENLREDMTEYLDEMQIPYENVYDPIYVNILSCTIKNDQVSFVNDDSIRYSNLLNLTLMPEGSYERASGEELSLSPGEVLVYFDGKALGESLVVGEQNYQVKKRTKDNISRGFLSDFTKNMVLVMTEEDFVKLFQELTEMENVIAGRFCQEFSLDIKGSREDEQAYGRQLAQYASELSEKEGLSEESWINKDIRADGYEGFYTTYGGLLFLGLFLGALFLMGAAMIIYYKQLSEGFEDKERFEIMQKVGMSKKEVRSAIRRQVVMVFFAPLLVAALHIFMAFPMVKRLLLLFGMNNSNLFAACTVITIGIFAAVYGLIYILTARTYYKIVERAV